MTNQHLITPPPELLGKWIHEANHNEPMFAQVAVMGAQWGADQQLAEDAKWLDQHALDAPHLKITPVGESLIKAMRPRQPSSLKEQALKGFHTISQFVLDEWSGCSDYKVYKEITDTVFRALEALPND